MNLLQKRAVPSDGSRRADLDRVVDSIRSGDPSGAHDIHRIFTPGARLLIGRRLGRKDVDAEGQEVLNAAIEEIRDGGVTEGSAVPTLVRRLIQERFGSHPSVPAHSGDETPGTEAAGNVLGRLEPIEREALRRCYVLGEKREAILEKLQLNLAHFRQIQSRARSEFSSHRSRTPNVA